MIILPERDRPVGRLLLPMSRSSWVEKSERPSRDPLCHGARTRFRLTARLDDGFAVWRGWFDDREDADAFLFAMARGTLGYERELWDLPAPHWRPGMHPGLSYDFATVSFLTTTGSNQTYTSPADWNNSNNSIEGLGGGASGNEATTTRTTGGGGGEYRILTNFSFASPGTTTSTYRIGTGGASSVGTAGTQTWWNATTFASSSLGCQNGALGSSGSGLQSGGLGGTGGRGGTGNDGGAGGSITGGATGSAVSTGGGGAGGPNGAGNAGGNNVGGGSTASAGGSGDAGHGGAGGTAGGSTGGNGGNGTEWDASHGSGGGSGGGESSSGAATSGTPGNYGAGAGSGGRAGSGATGSTSAGAQGILVVTYVPVIVSAGFNLAMLGM